MSEEKRLKRALNSGNLKLINSLYEELYNNYKGLVCFIIAKYVRDEEDVYDLAQDVFLDFFNNAEKVNSNIKYYLVSSSKNKALNYLRKTKKVLIVDDKDLDLYDDKTISNEFLYSETLHLMKNNLNDNEYKIIFLHLFENKTFAEISIKLSIKLSTVKTTYFRSIDKCREILKRRNTYDK